MIGGGLLTNFPRENKNMKEQIKIVNKKTGFVAIVEVESEMYHKLQFIVSKAIKMLDAEGGYNDIEIKLQ